MIERGKKGPSDSQLEYIMSASNIHWQHEMFDVRRAQNSFYSSKKKKRWRAIFAMYEEIWCAQRLSFDEFTNKCINLQASTPGICAMRRKKASKCCSLYLLFLLKSQLYICDMFFMLNFHHKLLVFHLICLLAALWVLSAFFLLYFWLFCNFLLCTRLVFLPYISLNKFIHLQSLVGWSAVYHLRTIV